MQTSAREAYLATQVMTATPQKLHLLLIEGAIRWLSAAQHHWRQNQEEQACEALIRSQEIVSEMLGGVSTGKQEVSRRLAEIYLYVYRTLTEAQLQHEEQKLQDALRVLEIERATWIAVCEKFGAQHDTAPVATNLAPPLTIQQNLPTGGLSIQA